MMLNKKTDAQRRMRYVVDAKRLVILKENAGRRIREGDSRSVHHHQHENRLTAGIVVGASKFAQCEKWSTYSPQVRKTKKQMEKFQYFHR